MYLQYQSEIFLRVTHLHVINLSVPLAVGAVSFLVDESKRGSRSLAALEKKGTARLNRPSRCENSRKETSGTIESSLIDPSRCRVPTSRRLNVFSLPAPPVGDVAEHERTIVR